MSAKSRYLEDAATLIDERVAALKEELASPYGKAQCERSKACDGAAISEAELCANLIRRIKGLRYRDTPYKCARDHRNRYGDTPQRKEE